jgi:pyridoxal phosphate enzyme (YggS family)
MTLIADNCLRVLERIDTIARRAGRDPSEIALIAVTKTVGPEGVREAFAAGLRRFGENRAQEFARKLASLDDLAAEWHFIGHLQTNKVRVVAPACALIHSVDRIDLARRIDERASGQAPRSVLVQVNTSGEASKSGIDPGGTAALLDDLAQLPGIRVDGLMTIGPLTGDARAIRAAFRRLREELERARAAGRQRAPLRHLSMGMSSDFAIAIEEGATLLRIGSAIFGPRA